MAKPSQLARLEALEAKRYQDDGITFVGRIVRNRDGSLTVYSDVSRDWFHEGPPEHVIEVVPKQRTAQWLRDLIRIEPNRYGAGHGD